MSHKSAVRTGHFMQPGMAQTFATKLYNTQERDNRYFRTTMPAKVNWKGKEGEGAKLRQETRYLTPETTSDTSADFGSQYFSSFRWGKSRKETEKEKLRWQIGMGWAEEEWHSVIHRVAKTGGFFRSCRGVAGVLLFFCMAGSIPVLCPRTARLTCWLAHCVRCVGLLTGPTALYSTGVFAS